MEDNLIVTYDCYPPDVSTLIVARKDKYDMTILNKIQGDEAFGIYFYLTGWAEMRKKEAATRADQIRSMNDEELAKFILDCDRNDLGFCHVGMCFDEETCTDCILKWLRKPVEE